MGRSDARVMRVERMRNVICRIAGSMLMVWLFSGHSARAESWALHLPMVLGSVAPSPPGDAGLGSPLATGSSTLPSALVTGTSNFSPHSQLETPRTTRPDGSLPQLGFAQGEREQLGPWGGFSEQLGPPVPETGYVPWENYGTEMDSVLSDFTELELILEDGDEWTWQVMPTGLLYRSYMAGAKEPRFSSYLNRDTALGQIWDASLGGRLGLLRYGNQDQFFPEGWQIDLEGGCQARLDPIADSTPLLSVDFRVGVPVTWAQGPWQFKTGYYHISAHLGDEFLLLFPDARRLNYTRDAIMLGLGYYWIDSVRLYGEVAYSVNANDGAEPWEMQFGVDWIPAYDTGVRGAPFAAINAHLREEVDFNGNLVVQAGWAWRRHAHSSLFRTGIQYYRGKSDQYEYFDHSERRIGWGMWADY